MRKKLFIIGILSLCLFIVFIKFYGTTVPNRNNVSLDGLSISLDSSWDYENADILPTMGSDLIKRLSGRGISKKVEKSTVSEAINIQIEHYFLASNTFQEYMDNYITIPEEEEIFNEEFNIDGYKAIKFLHKTDQFMQYSIVVGKDHYFYSIVFHTHPDNYDIYIDEIEAIINTIKIKSME